MSEALEASEALKASEALEASEASEASEALEASEAGWEASARSIEHWRRRCWRQATRLKALGGGDACSVGASW